VQGFSFYKSAVDLRMENLRRSSHSVHQLHVDVVWSTKYRYGVLRGEVQLRCRDLIRQICDAMDVRILKGVVSKDHIHLHLSYPPKVSVSDLVKRLAGVRGYY
jgi:putative transposase